MSWLLLATTVELPLICKAAAGSSSDWYSSWPHRPFCYFSRDVLQPHPYKALATSESLHYCRVFSFILQWLLTSF